MRNKIIVIDTNVLVSAALGNGYCTKIVSSLQVDNLLKVCYSPEVLSEYKEVANYSRIIKKYPLFKLKVETMISKLETGGLKFFIAENFALLKDHSDNKFLDLAYACQADYLITGNHLDFTITQFHQTKIVNPKMFWELYETHQL